MSQGGGLLGFSVLHPYSSHK